jgi:signal transduction histidine kinase
VDLADVAGAASAPLQRAGVALVADLMPAGPVRADRDALLLVGQNLLANAVEAAGADGVVSVRTYAEQGCAVLAVADTGPGMSDEFIRSRPFTPFRSTKRGGWGIGAYQSKMLVEAHGGRIEVTSKVGGGSTFLVRLPLAQPETNR